MEMFCAWESMLYSKVAHLIQCIHYEFHYDDRLNEKGYDDMSTSSRSVVVVGKGTHVTAGIWMYRLYIHVQTVL